MTKEICNPEYLAKALLLSGEEKERVLSRMSGKLPRRLAKDKLTVDEALAIQLEIEDEQLAEWRDRMHAIKAKEAERERRKKEKAEEKQAKAAAEKAPKPDDKAGKRAKKDAPADPVQTEAAAPAKTKTRGAAKATVTKLAAKRATP